MEFINWIQGVFGSMGNLVSLATSAIIIFICVMFIKRVLFKGILIAIAIAIVLGVTTGSFNLATIMPTSISLITRFFGMAKAFISYLLGFVTIWS